MADKTPVRVVFNESNVATGLAEFQSGDTVGTSFGGTGLSSLGSALQVLRVNAAGNALEFGTLEDLGDIGSIGSTLTAPSNADFTITTAGTGNIVLNDLTISDNAISTNRSNDDLLINASGSLTGIKVDTGAKTLAGSKEEKITEGLDGLRERLKDYYKLGARFTKWRAVYSISDKYPSKLSISVNAHALARYAALVQEAGMVPIIEPEVLMDGNHSAKDCMNKTSEVIRKCYEELDLHNVDLKGTILKPNMILPGVKAKNKSNPTEISSLTLKCLKENVPTEVPGIAFLSGGQTEIEATQNLNEINKINDTNFLISFSYGRALQQSALKNWAKDIKDTSNTQKIFNHRSKMNGLSTSAKWSIDLEKQITA